MIFMLFSRYQLSNVNPSGVITMVTLKDAIILYLSAYENLIFGDNDGRGISVEMDIVNVQASSQSAIVDYKLRFIQYPQCIDVFVYLCLTAKHCVEQS